jgi:hypothetical protein
MFLYTGITRLGDGMALYTGDSGDPVFRGWLKSEEEHYYFAIVRHLRANRRVLVGSGASAPGLQTTVLIRKGTSGMGQWAGGIYARGFIFGSFPVCQTPS